MGAARLAATWPAIQGMDLIRADDEGVGCGVAGIGEKGRLWAARLPAGRAERSLRGISYISPRGDAIWSGHLKVPADGSVHLEVCSAFFFILCFLFSFPVVLFSFFYFIYV